MAVRVTAKVRLVKCPKCRMLLAELPDLDVYRCGGCNATLQAKKRASDAKTTTSSLHDKGASQTDKLDHVSESKEPSSSCNSKKLEVSNKVCSPIENNGNVNGKLADNEIEDLADNKNEDLVDNGKEVLTDVENGGLADGENKDMADNGNEELANSKNEEFPDNEDVEFGYKVSEGFAHQNGHFGDNKNGESEDNENDGFSHQNGHLADKGNGESEDNENEGFAHNKIGDLAHNEIEDLADNKNEDLADNENDDLADKENEDLADNENKGFANNGSGELADNENEELLDSEDEKFAYKENEGFAHENGHFADNENEESEDNQNEGFAHNKTEDFAHNENEEFEHNENEEIADNGSKEFSHKKNEEFAHNSNEEPLPLAGTDSKLAENDEFSPLTDVNIVDVKRKSDSNFGSSSTVKLVAMVGNGSIVSAHRPVGEGISSDTLISSPSEQLEKPQVCVHQGSGHVRSIRTSESMEFNPSSELSGTLRNTSKSSTVRSSHFYDGSVSSYDGIDDQLPNSQLHPFQDTYNTSHFGHSEERSGRDKFTVNKNSQMQHPARNSWSDKKKHVLKNSNWDQDEFHEPARYGHKNQNWTRLERDEYQPWLPFPQIGLHAGYKNGSSSSQFHDEFQRNSGFQSSDLSEDLEQDKVKLMRMIFELQDQLNKTLSLHEMGNDGISEPSRKPRYVPRYHNYDANYDSLEEEHFHHSNYPRYGRYGARSSYSQDPRSMQIPFSGETTGSGHQVDPSCLHCHPQNWQRSARLPPPLLYHRNKKCRIHPGHNYCTPYSSCPSSPQRFVDSEFPLRGREAMSDDQRRRSHEVKSLRDKTHLVKRHLRPIAGGAPFITCYKCFKLLQLPADFLLFKRRSHRLRCGACSELLKFSLHDGSHIVPYTLNTTVPPPSEVEDCSGAIDRRNFPLTSDTNDHFVQADPMSCSDDYGLSYCRSCSTEGDLVATAPYHTCQGSMEGKRASNGSFDPMRYRKRLVSKQSGNKYKNSMLRYESAGSSSNMHKAEKFSSEIKRLQQSSGSPLHRLMGYSSPSQLIRGFEPSGKRTNQNSM
ncbi:hypothetical protein FNV43_RR24354 [Rhamnella rubrinervis]|uniref:Zinc-ribbon domain-containing protein n=1 Tax=Rhamnella rubrinervis TaxID=2594499 RepID=A0A8K0DXX9_9ROSA|nr:hypothetical protein FNV43_RR24354 [Rhamnella rubrinervis]